MKNSPKLKVSKTGQRFVDALNRAVLKSSREEDQYYSIEEVAKMLKVAYLTVYRWIQTKKLVALKAGKQYRIKKEDVNNFLKNS